MSWLRTLLSCDGPAGLLETVAGLSRTNPGGVFNRSLSDCHLAHALINTGGERTVDGFLELDWSGNVSVARGGLRLDAHRALATCLRLACPGDSRVICRKPHQGPCFIIRIFAKWALKCRLELRVVVGPHAIGLRPITCKETPDLQRDLRPDTALFLGLFSSLTLSLTSSLLLCLLLGLLIIQNALHEAGKACELIGIDRLWLAIIGQR